mmetsp:Transcript_17776/g.50616  ORF Transcript_17776/g.50616 Transcript_17776/m.50616 type:complete len:378 (-) Transcript_17776:2439-3572(-)
MPQYSAAKQPDHSSHWPHWQSLSLSHGPPSSVQPRASTRSRVQPLPPNCPALMICRSRVWCPEPQFARHCDHSVHCDTWQSFSLHVSSLQLCVSPMSPLQGSPPLWASTRISRVRKRWPPPQRTWQSPHGSQSAHVQFTTFFSGHGPASKTAPSHGRPSLFATDIERFRVAWRPPFSQPDQSSQSARTQSSPSAPQTWSLHERIILMTPEHGLPPPLACDATWRTFSCWPPPHGLEHSLQPVHSLSWQSATSWALPSQGAVSVKGPSQPWPNGPAMPSMLRSRVFWPVPPVHGDHAPHSAKEHVLFAKHSAFKHSFVSASGPSHCWPPHFACLTTARPRRQRPSQSTGCCHSDHSENSQSCGSHDAEWQTGMSSQFT